ncbi:MAG: hypothetical protein IPF62_11010 [Bacteroidetes bacterium]|nr:hypothetical protein [Bacteroidota bacterium]
MEDSLVILYSTNCGNTDNLTKLFKTTLINNGTAATEYNPSRCLGSKTIALPAPALTNSTFFKIRYRPSDLSNNVYIDNFEINSSPVSVKMFLLLGLI